MVGEEPELLVLAKKALGLTCAGGVRLEGGVINENWRVETDDGARVVRVYPPNRKTRQVAFEMALHEHLRERNCEVPQVFRPQAGEQVPTIGGRPTVLLEFLPGRPLAFGEGHNLSPERLAALLCPIDQALEEFSPPFRPVAETHVFQNQLVFLFGRDHAKREKLQDLFERLQAWEASVSIPSRVIHADIHAGNILVERGQPLESGKLWLIDFDDAHVSYRVIDWVLPALEFSLHRDGTIDEARYEEILNLLSRNRTHGEEEAFAQVRTMMLLKFAASFAGIGHPPDKNPYLLALERNGLE